MREWVSLTVIGYVLAVSVATAQVPTETSTATVTLDLEGCLAKALAQAPSLRAASAASDAAGAALAEARARRWPTLGIGGSFQYTSESMKQELSLGPGLPTRTLEFGDGKVAEFNLGLSFPLFTGGELDRTAQAAAAGESAARLNEQAQRLDLTLEVRRVFVTALGRQAQIQATHLAVSRLERHLENVEGALAAGAATEENRLRVRAQISQARQRHLHAMAAGDSAGLALGRLLGEPASIIFPRGDLATSFLLGRDLGAERPADRPDLAALAQQQSRRELLAAAARGRLWPRLGADVRAHYGRPGVNPLANDWMSYATAGVKLDWPLWDAGARKLRVQQEAARARGIAAQHSQLSQALTAAHTTAQIQLQSADQQQEQARERVDLQRRIHEFVGQRLGNAAATETEYLDSLDDMTQAEIDLTLALMRVRLAEAALLWTVGE